MWLKVLLTGLLFFFISSICVPFASDEICPESVKRGIMLMWCGSVLAIVISILILIWS